ncbi:hypothetical protein [Streptomyces sp. NBC_01320]|nr:hypothetical protein OG395_57175 [Streptomyces sp. NBC_01320]
MAKGGGFSGQGWVQPPTAERAVSAAEAAETNGILARLRRT